MRVAHFSSVRRPAEIPIAYMRALPQVEEFAAFVRAFGLNDFRAGTHEERNENGWCLTRKEVNYLWLAKIQPSFDRPAYLMVVSIEDRLTGTFCVRGNENFLLANRTPVDCSRVGDLVSGCLERIDLSPQNRGMDVDGIGYSISVRSPALRFDLVFADHGSRPLVDLGDALYRVAMASPRLLKILNSMNI